MLPIYKKKFGACSSQPSQHKAMDPFIPKVTCKTSTTKISFYGLVVLGDQQSEVHETTTRTPHRPLAQHLDSDVKKGIKPRIEREIVAKISGGASSILCNNIKKD